MKLIHLTVEGCADCPFLRFDDGKTIEKDSGWDCALAGNRRIVDQGDRWDFSGSSFNEDPEELEMELEPIMRACGIYLHPDWCPLPEAI